MIDPTLSPQQRAEAAENRSERFRALLANPYLAEALDALRDESISTWRTTGVNEQAAREDAWQSLRAVDRLMRYIGAQADDGAVQAHNMKAALAAVPKRSR